MILFNSLGDLSTIETNDNCKRVVHYISVHPLTRIEQDDQLVVIVTDEVVDDHRQTVYVCRTAVCLRRVVSVVTERLIAVKFDHVPSAGARDVDGNRTVIVSMWRVL